jgi:hypothetical protein
LTSRARFLRAAGYVAAAAVVGELVRQVLATRALAAEGLAAFAVDFVATRALAGTWYGGATTKRGAAQGAIHGAAAVAAAVVIALVTGQARVAGTSMGWDTVPLGALTAAATAIRIELVCRVLPIALFEGLVPARAVSAFAVLAGVVPVLATTPDRPGAIVLALAVGALSTALVRITGAAIAAVVAHTVIRFLTGPVLTSTLEIRWASGSLVPFDRAGGAAAYLLAAACGVATLVIVRPRGVRGAGAR